MCKPMILIDLEGFLPNLQDGKRIKQVMKQKPFTRLGIFTPSRYHRCSCGVIFRKGANGTMPCMNNHRR